MTKQKIYWTAGPLTLLASREKPREKILRKGLPRELGALVERLLVVGGHTVVIPFDSIDMTPIFLSRENRNETPPKKIRSARGRVSGCHENAARLWKKSPKRTELVTGYALSADGVWRRHSWTMIGETLVETTEPRTHYVGFKLPLAEAKRFYEAYGA